MIVALVLLSGCATPIRQVDLPRAELQTTCRTTNPIYGCADFCPTIYVLREADHPNHAEYLDTIEHERRHCREGNFHTEGVVLPVTPSMLFRRVY
jgi:hypothetical protein